MNYEQWHAEADRLKKCLDYAPTGSQANVFREALQDHLHTMPVQPTTAEAKNVVYDLGYMEAFYEMAKALGVDNARTSSPEIVFATVILPALKQAVADSKRLAKLEDLVRVYRNSSVALSYTPGETGFSVTTRDTHFDKRSTLRQLLDVVR